MLTQIEKALSRRQLLGGIVAGAAVNRLQAAPPGPAPALALPPAPICVFSKQFHWTDVREMCAIAKEVGFDGIDLTVRNGGHVVPEKVERDLPKAVETIHQSGLAIPMITAEIVDTNSPHCEAILRTAAGLGIRYYRWGWFKYDYDRDLNAQLESFKPKIDALAQMNEKYKICAMYDTHSGLGMVGAPILDMYYLIKGLDPRYTGFSYDVGHATAEGGVSAWVDNFRIVEKYVRGIVVKDFVWARNEKGQWEHKWCTDGEGMVNWGRFFQMVRAANFAGPVQMHCKDPRLGGAQNGKKPTISRDELKKIIADNLAFVKGEMRKAGIIVS
jgi:sugar phosphate isomerase/epimerase